MILKCTDVAVPCLIFVPEMSFSRPAAFQMDLMALSIVDVVIGPGDGVLLGKVTKTGAEFPSRELLYPGNLALPFRNPCTCLQRRSSSTRVTGDIWPV